MKHNFRSWEEYQKWQREQSLKDLLIALVILGLVAFLLLGKLAGAQEIQPADVNVEQLADAIFHAEGGYKAEYLYGIRSVHYESRKEARRICINTIRNNIKRYREYGYKDYPDYLSFLASRYCPVTGKNLSRAEKRLNHHWINNVLWFLEHPKGV